MRITDLLKPEAEMAFEEMLTAIDGVSEHQSWAVLPNLGSDYLHSDASIHGITLHVASGKFLYGSCAYRDMEVRWRHCAERIDAFEPNWSAAVEYLREAHAYWMGCWADLSDEDVERPCNHFRGDRVWPAWKVIRMITHHDSYHAGQIAVLRYGCPETDVPPPSSAQDLRDSCVNLPSW